jgi:hypothetical protein
VGGNVTAQSETFSGRLLELSRETIVRSQRLDYALVSFLERDPLLAERLKRLRTVSGVGPITALTWAPGDRGLHTIPVDQGSHQLLRAMRRREELGRQGATHASFQAAEQAYAARAGGSCQAGAADEPRSGGGPLAGARHCSSLSHLHWHKSSRALQDAALAEKKLRKMDMK